MQQRAVTIVLGVAVVALAVLLVVKSTPRSASEVAVVDAAVAAVDAGTVADGGGASPVADDISIPPQETADGGSFHLADGTVVPPLGSKAPKEVRFGVVLVTYEGEQGASSKARSRKDAIALATKLSEDAKSDFGGAVRAGDDGSASDVGIVDRNILEPTSEAVLFALPVGATSGVIDTPRGFWIVKRLE